MTPKKIDVVMHMYMLIEYSNVYSKTSESLWQYCRVESALNAANGEIKSFLVRAVIVLHSNLNQK